MTTISHVPEIDAADFERELRQHRPLVVLDTRPPEAYAEYHLDAAGADLRNVPEDLVDADPDAVVESLPADRPLRIICTSGRSSARVAATLLEHGRDAVSVRGGLVDWSSLLVAGEVDVEGPVRIVQLRREARGCLSYVIASGGEALVVDPTRDLDAYVDAARGLGAEITRVFDTHVHADHVSGARALARRTGATLHLSAEALRRGVVYPIQPAVDGDLLLLGAIELRVVALPGHTTDMTGLLIGEAALVGGDSLFADSVARPDLEDGDDGAPAAARVLHRTLSDVIGPLPDDTVLLPCHYPGGRLAGPLAPTLGEVRTVVPELRLDTDAFVDHVVSELPAKPANFLAIISQNLGTSDGRDVDVSTLELGANRCAARSSWGEVGRAVPDAGPAPSRAGR